MDLKPEQVQAICHLYEGIDVFLWLPTAFGKSVCYEVLPFLFDFRLSQVDIRSSMTIATSPLLSLMVHQVSSLQVCGVRASSMRSVDEDLLAADSDVEAGKYNLLFSAYEAIIGCEKWRELLLRPPLSECVVAVAIDEAHCVSKWQVELYLCIPCSQGSHDSCCPTYMGHGVALIIHTAHNLRLLKVCLL